MDVVDRSDRLEVLGGLSPSLRVPTLVLDDGRPLAESGAILLYLAEGSDFLPADRFERAQVAQWLFFEQYEVEPKIAVARFFLQMWPGERDEARIAKMRDASRHALRRMERHLRDGEREWFVGGSYSIADIALNGYTHVADGAGIELADCRRAGPAAPRPAGRRSHRARGRR